MESLRRLKGKMMGFGSTVTSSGGTPSPQQALEMAKIHLTGASSSTDPNIAIRLCHEAERLLEKAVKRTEHRAMLDEIATAYVGLGRLLESLGRDSEAQDIYKKAEKLGGTSQGPTRSTKSSRASSATQSTGALLSTGGTQVSGPSHRSSVHHQTQVGDIAMTFENIYEENARSPSFEYKLPEPDERLRNTQELAYCLGLLRVASDDILDPATQKWLAVIRKDTDEQERLRALVTDVIRAFKRDEPKDAKAVAEVVCLASVLEKEDYRYLLKELYSGVEKTYLLDYHQLHGLAQLIQDADPGHLDADDLVKILQLLNMRLNNTHNQSSYHMYQLTIALSRVLDAMADAKVTGLDRKSLHEPLSTFLGGLKKSSDPYLVYQAAYAHQALLYVPDNESAWQSAMRHSGKVFKGVSGMVSAVKGIDLAKFIDSLEDIQKGLSGASKAFDLVMDTYKDVKSLVNSGQTLRKSLEGGLSFQYKRDWYAALRGADVLIRDGELSKFKKLVCDAPCRLDPGFQWGVCQRLGEIAGNPLWDEATCLRSIEFLGEIYKNDNVWGRQSSVKQWILNILMQLASSESTLQGMRNHDY
ncbi:hypothetical protein BGX31_011090 [Mortierella sp. GBA43]|nr:hypothetical protein BGX31_011090 [Mortierella sp. GBA43]